MMQVTERERVKKEDGKNVTIVQANDVVVIQNGIITNNPFIFRLEKSITSQWMIENRGKVLSRISFYFREYYGVGYGGNEDDCFGYAVDYFMESKKRAFRPSYFGHATTYSVEQYCLSHLKYIVRNYLKGLNGGLNVQAIVTTGEKEICRGGLVDETLEIDQLSVEDMVLIRDVEMWDEQFEWLMEYEDYFLDKNYKDFDIMGYMAHMFFDVIHDTIEEHATYVAEQINESVELIRLVTEDFRLDVAQKEDVAVEMLQEIKVLLEETKNVWKPKYIRDKQKRKTE